MEDSDRTSVRARFRLVHRGEEHRLVDQVDIGRAADCKVRLNNGLVSRHHARLSSTDDSLTIEDIGSRNGVFVNGRRIDRPTQLVHGDGITIGSESFEVVDVLVLDRPESLSTVPPPISRPRPYELSDLDQLDQVTMTARTRLDVLSEREREVFGLLTLGHTQREISERLHISTKTVESHRAHIYSKLECTSRAELVSCAIDGGMLRSLKPWAFTFRD